LKYELELETIVIELIHVHFVGSVNHAINAPSF